MALSDAWFFPGARPVYTESSSMRAAAPGGNMQGRAYARGLSFLVAVSVTLAGSAALAAEPSATDQWTHLGGDVESHQYSSLTQITSQNVHSLGLLLWVLEPADSRRA